MGRRGNVSGAPQKQFVKIFDSICSWNARWERWNDMVNLFACCIAGAVDYVHAEERGRRVEEIRRRYSPEEFARFDDLFAELVNALEENPYQDYLGQMYMELELGSHWHGQFFTPYNVCLMMAKTFVTDRTLRQIEDRGWIAANDPACGGGATLIAFAGALKKAGVNYQQRVLFVGQDLDHTVAMMCYIQLSLLGCAGYVHIGDTLTAPLTGDVLMPDGSENTWYTPMYFSDIWAGRIIARRLDKILQRMSVIKPRNDENEKQIDENVSEERREPDGEQPVQLSLFG